MIQLLHLNVESQSQSKLLLWSVGLGQPPSRVRQLAERGGVSKGLVPRCHSDPPEPHNLSHAFERSHADQRLPNIAEVVSA